MTRKDANVYLAAILETLAETGMGAAPSGTMYAALMGRMSLDDYQGLLGIAKSCGLVSENGSHLVTITIKGQETVAKIRQAREATV